MTLELNLNITRTIPKERGRGSSMVRNVRVDGNPLHPSPYHRDLLTFRFGWKPVEENVTEDGRPRENFPYHVSFDSPSSSFSRSTTRFYPSSVFRYPRFSPDPSDNSTVLGTSPFTVTNTSPTGPGGKSTEEVLVDRIRLRKDLLRFRDVRKEKGTPNVI